MRTNCDRSQALRQVAERVKQLSDRIVPRQALSNAAVQNQAIVL